MSKYGQLDVAKDETGEGLGMDELNIAGGIEQVSEFDWRQIAEVEKFMNERLVIMVFPDRSEGALRVIRPEVNGLCQPILRGVKTKVKRKYVEALARTISTSYDQVQRDPSDRSSLEMIPMSNQTYPFTVIHDPNPAGRAWLEAIIAEKN